ncbi:hypothetical protein Skr01_43130 [Sphaerisporangium krabiense]|nr:hypothetical protein Skr01_43130 [Sphaerisporangium krabiense]
MPEAPVKEHRDLRLGEHQVGVRRTFGSGRTETRYRSPSACTARRKASSGLVSLPLFDCMLLRTPSLDAPTGLAVAIRLPYERYARARIGAALLISAAMC